MNTQSINRFLGACGATGPLRLSAERPRVFGPVSVSLEKPFALIGSGVHADLRLDDNQVSHRHLYLQVYDGRAFAVDLGSRTGTFWESGQQPYGWLNPGQSLWIGRHQIRLEEDTPAKKASGSSGEGLLSRDYTYPGLPPVSLEFVKGGINKGGERRSANCNLNRVMVLLGRTEGCKIRLMDSSVSKFHCSLIRTPRGVWVVDLLSRNGIWVNGTKVPWARLEQGDRLEVGEFVLRLRYDQPDNESPDAKPNTNLSEPAARNQEPVATDDPGESHPSAVPAQIASEPSPIIEEHEAAHAAKHHALVVSPGRGMIPVELSESIAVMIANQFSQLQQQMFDQFHQAMLVMFQTFSNLHRDQMEIVRQELDRVHELTRQLHALQAELAKQPVAAKDPEVQKLLKETQAEAASPAADPAHAFSPDRWEEAFREAAEKVMAATSESKQPAGTVKTDQPIFTFSAETLPHDVPEGIKEVAAEVSPNREAMNLEMNEGQSSQKSQSVPPVAADIHAMLCQKIAALQAERQSRWQKIIGFLAGKQTGEAMP